MHSTKRLLILLTALLGVEGVTGSALAGFVVEGDMDSFTAVLLVIMAMGGTFIGTVWLFMQQVIKGRQSKNRLIKTFSEQLYRDMNGSNPADPTEVLQELNLNMKKLIELMMNERANRPQEPWERPL